MKNIIFTLCMLLSCVIIVFQQFDRKNLINQIEELTIEEELVEKEVTMDELVGFYLLHSSPVNDSLFLEVAYNFIDTNKAIAILSQAKLESGHKFNSKLAIEDHNLFGMRYSPNDPLVIGSDNGWAMYACWEHSLISRILWEDRVTIDHTNYLQSISNVYATDENYYYKWKSILKRHQIK